MKRRSCKKKDFVENPAIDAFIAEVMEVSKRHGFSIAHEDYQGAFEIHDYYEGDADWLLNAHDDTGE